MKKVSISLATLLLIATGANGLHGNLIAFDPFNSTTSSAAADPANGLYFSNVNGANGALGSEENLNAAGGNIVGFGASPWDQTVTTFRVQSSRLVSDSRTELDNGAVRVLNFRGTGGPSTTFRTASRDLNAAAPASNVYYMSSIMQVFTDESGHEANAFLMLGFGNDMVSDSSVMSATSSSTFEGLFVGFRANETGDAIDLVARATTDATANSLTDVTILENVQQQQNYFVAARVEVNDAGQDTVTVWLDPDFSLTDPAGGISFSADVLSGGAGLTRFAALQQGLLHSGGSGSTNRVGYFDGIALGTTYAAVVPEPSTYALILGGILLALAIRFRRKGRA